MRCYAAHALDPKRLQRLEGHMQLLLRAHADHLQQVAQSDESSTSATALQQQQQGQQGPGQGDALAGLSRLLARCMALLPASKSALRHSYVLAYYLADLPGRRYLETLQGGGGVGMGQWGPGCVRAGMRLHACLCAAWLCACRHAVPGRPGCVRAGMRCQAGLAAACAACAACVDSEPLSRQLYTHMQAQLAEASERLLSVLESLPGAERVLQQQAAQQQQQQEAGAVPAPGVAAAAMSAVYSTATSWCTFVWSRLSPWSSSSSGNGGSSGSGSNSNSKEDPAAAADAQREQHAAQLAQQLAALGPQHMQQQLEYLTLLAAQLGRLQQLEADVARWQHCLLGAARRGLLTGGAAAGAADKVTLLDVVDMAASSSRHIARATGKLLGWAMG
jgi:hypothetical protein